MTTRFRCVVCGKVTAGRMPRDERGRSGDTTARYPRRHKDEYGRNCPGSLRHAEWVETEDIQ